MKLHRTLFTAWVFAAGVALHAQNAHNMVVQTNKLGAEIQPTMYGLFFEDINYGADGGLYAELVKNRSFEFPQRFMGWNVFLPLSALRLPALSAIQSPVPDHLKGPRQSH